MESLAVSLPLLRLDLTNEDLAEAVRPEWHTHKEGTVVPKSKADTKCNPSILIQPKIAEPRGWAPPVKIASGPAADSVVAALLAHGMDPNQSAVRTRSDSLKDRSLSQPCVLMQRSLPFFNS